MNKYGQYCPIARAAEILGDRWTLLIVRDLLYGAQHFNELERGLPGIPKALLTERLRRLQQVGVIERKVAPTGRKISYQLTEAGRELQPVMDGMLHWGARWAFGEPETSELNPVLLLWWMRDGVNKENLPADRIVIEFTFRETNRDHYWLVLKPEDVTMCIKHPGFDIDVLVTADLAAMYQVWLGRLTLNQAILEERVIIDAAPHLIQAFPHWFALSPMADAVQAAVEPPAFREILAG